MKIGFNKPYCTGKETYYIASAINQQKISGDGYYTSLCHRFFEERYQFKKVLLTASCTDALEMAAILLDIEPGDEVIIPSYTFVSTANAFVLRGAKIVFADSCADHPNIDSSLIESLITSKTKAIVVVHYAGIACDMDEIMAIAEKYNLFVVEDAAQAIDGYYKNRPLGSIGHLGCFSFHETKNITCGEGGLLAINDQRFFKRAEIVWEKGTNRSAFFRGESPEYGWLDIGSSFLASEINAAFLFAQLEEFDQIQERRKQIWNNYFQRLQKYIPAQLPFVPEYSSNNAHMFYLTCKNLAERDRLLTDLNAHNIQAIFHYLPLHKSPYYKNKHDGRQLPNACKFADCIVRLPLYLELTSAQQAFIASHVAAFFTSKKKRGYSAQPPSIVKLLPEKKILLNIEK